MTTDDCSHAEYIGWVPILALSSGLSLDPLSKHSSSNRLKFYHYEKVEDKALISFAFTTTRKYSEKISDIYRGVRSCFDFVQLGFEVNEGSYEGCVYIWPTVKNKQLEIYSTLDNLAASAHKGMDIRQQLRVIEKDSPEDLPSSFVKVSFFLKKNGITRLKFLKPPKCEIPDSCVCRIIINQTLNLIRDLFHTHEFHSSDYSVSTATEFSKNEPYEVGKKLLGNLISEIQRQRRYILAEGSIPSYFSGYAASNADGIAQYALALLQICKDEEYIEDQDIELFSNDIRRLQTATDSFVRGIATEVETRRDIVNDTRTKLLFVLALFSAAAIFMQTSIEKLVEQARELSGEKSLIADSIAKLFAQDRNVLLMAIGGYLFYRSIIFTHQKVVVYRLRTKAEKLSSAISNNTFMFVFRMLTNEPLMEKIIFGFSLLTIFLVAILVITKLV